LNGIHSAEALGLARYFMYEQVYFHHVRRVYDLHLIEFMKEFYGNGGYKVEIDFHLRQTDNEVLSAMREACKRQRCPHPWRVAD
jgi:HD superfamily phosphohydrolase